MFRRKESRTSVKAFTIENKRESLALDLRKQDREERISKKRAKPQTPFMPLQHSTPLQPPGQIPGEIPDAGITPAVVEGCFSDNIKIQYQAARQVRQAFKQDNFKYIISQLNTSHLIPRFVSFLQTPNLELIYETTWILLNIASGPREATNKVVQAGAIPELLRLLTTLHRRGDEAMKILEHIIWTLANIAGEHDVAYYIAQKALPQIIDTLRGSSPTLQALVASLLSNLAESKPALSFEQMKQIMPPLQLLIHSPDTPVSMEALRCLGNITLEV